MPCTCSGSRPLRNCQAWVDRWHPRDRRPPAGASRTSSLAGLKSAVRKRTSNWCTCAANCAITCWISASWARRTSVADVFFFDSGEPLRAGTFAEQLHVLLAQRLKLRMGGEVFLHRGDLVRRHVLGDIASLLPTLQIVIRALGPLPQDAELALLELLDARDFLEEVFRRGCGVHGRDISYPIYNATKNNGGACPQKNFVLHPDGTGAEDLTHEKFEQALYGKVLFRADK